MWYILLFLCLLLGMITLFLISKWTLIFHLVPNRLELTVKVICFTKKIVIPGDTKRKENKKTAKKKRGKNIEKPDQSSSNTTENSTDGILDKIHDCKVKILAYKNIVFDALESLKDRIEVLNTWIRLDFGTGDAARTGQAVGYIWSVIGICYPIMNRYFIMDFPAVHITPDFYQKRLDYEVKSIIKAKPVHIIKTLFVLVFSYLNMKKIKEV